MPRSTSRQQPGPEPLPGAAAGPWTREVRTLTRTVAASGVVFAVLFVVALVLVRQAPGIAVPDRVYAAFYTVGQGNLLVTVGLYVVPFTGIAFMWHMSATRTLVDALPGPTREVPRWLQVTSGVLWVCMLFAGTAAVAAVALLTRLSSTPLQHDLPPRRPAGVPRLGAAALRRAGRDGVAAPRRRPDGPSQRRRPRPTQPWRFSSPGPEEPR